jgi:hypothetical protein
VGKPSTPARPSATTSAPDQRATVSVLLGSPRAKAFTQLQWESSKGPGGMVNCPCSNPTRFATSNLGVDPNQRIRVRSFNGSAWSDWSQYSVDKDFDGTAGADPYGPTLVPGAFNATRSSDDPVWTWNLRTNGRPIANVQYAGSFDGTAGAIERLQRNGSKGSTYSLRVRAKSAAGWSGWTNTESVSIPKPTVEVKKGSTCDERSCATGNGSCTSAGCRWIAVQTSGFNGSVTCTFRENGSTVSGWRNLSMGGNAYKESDNFYGGTGRVTAQCDGVSGHLDW